MTLKTTGGNFKLDRRKKHKNKEAGWLNIEVGGFSETSVAQPTLKDCHYIKTGSMSTLKLCNKYKKLQGLNNK